MRIDDVIYFSPGIKAIDVDFSNKRMIVSAFHARIKEYYLIPAKILNEQEMAFAAGTLLMTAIEAITQYSIGGNNRIEEFAKATQFFTEIRLETDRNTTAKAFEENFRNGLIHEGRIKNCSQFSYDFTFLIQVHDNFLVINPSILYIEVEEYFEAYINKLDHEPDTYLRFIRKLRSTFENEINQLKNI